MKKAALEFKKGSSALLRIQESSELLVIEEPPKSSRQPENFSLYILESADV